MEILMSLVCSKDKTLGNTLQKIKIFFLIPHGLFISHDYSFIERTVR